MNACTNEPVASVPMNESIFMTTTTMPLMTPMTNAAPTPSKHASGTLRWLDTTKCAATQPESVIV